MVEIGGQAAHEHGRPHPGNIEPGRAEVLEAHGRQVELDRRLDEIASGNLVQFRAWQAVGFAVALVVEVIDIIVAKPAEEEIRERLLPIVWRKSRRLAEPDRRVPNRESEAAIESAANACEQPAIDSRCL